MRCIPFVLFLAAVFGLNLPAYTQIPGVAGSGPTRASDRERRATEANLEKRRSQMKALETRKRTRSEGALEATAIRRSNNREWELDLREMRTVDPADLKKYEDFLRNDKTGIFKLLPNFDCIAKNLIRIADECAGFAPDSSDYSFRRNKYSDPQYHDIGFNRDEIVTNAFFSQGILVSLGDVPIDGVNLKHGGLEFLVNFQPDLKPSDVRKTATKFVTGVESGSYKYARSVNAVENTTYALRSVAYKIGNSLPFYWQGKSLEELRFLGLIQDKRVDVVVVFRIVRKDADGNATILWKELDRKAAPTIKFAKGEPLSDVRPQTDHDK